MDLPHRLSQAFKDQFGTRPALLVRAPGRVNLIGEHTDYNAGLVLPMAIDRAVWIALRPRADRQVTVHSLDFNQTVTFSLDRLQKEDPHWAEYLKGVAWVLQQAGMTLKGWEGVLAGDVPIGAGLSSSAATELAVLRAFAEVSRLKWDAVYAAQLAQQAENQWVGVNCGIMDQMVASIANFRHALFLDCRTLKYDHILIPSSLAFVVLDTTTRRELINSAYNERRLQCAAAERALGVQSLRDVTPEMLAMKSRELDEISLRRAHHVVSENGRVVEAVAALLNGEARLLGSLFNASHASLRDDFEVSSPALNQIVAAALEHPACYGARMTGAGFAGCALALVRAKEVKFFSAFVSERYRQVSGRDPAIYVCTAGQGASLVKNRRLTL